MNWRANNYVDEVIIEGETYIQVCGYIKNHRLAGEWVIEYYDSNNMWIEMEVINVSADTGILNAVRASHLEHF